MYLLNWLPSRPRIGATALSSVYPKSHRILPLLFAPTNSLRTQLPCSLSSFSPSLPFRLPARTSQDPGHGVHKLSYEVLSVGLQNGYRTPRAVHKNLQHRAGVLGHDSAKLLPLNGQSGQALHLLYGPEMSVSLQNAEGCKVALQRNLQHGLGGLGQEDCEGGQAVVVLVVDVLVLDLLLVVDVGGIVVVVVTRQEQAEERRERELAQGCERAVGVGEGAL